MQPAIYTNKQILEQYRDYDDSHWFVNIIHLQGLPQDLTYIRNEYFNDPWCRIDREKLEYLLDTPWREDEYTGEIMATLLRFESDNKYQMTESLSALWETIQTVTQGILTRLQNANVKLTEEQVKWFNLIINHGKDDPYFPFHHAVEWIEKISIFNPSITGYDFDPSKQLQSDMATWGYVDITNEELDQDATETACEIEGDNLYVVNCTKLNPPVEALRLLSLNHDVEIRLLSGNGLVTMDYVIKNGIVEKSIKEVSPRDVEAYLDPLSLLDDYDWKFKITPEELDHLDDEPIVE